MHELAVLRHPGLDATPRTLPKVYLPRFGLHATYSLSHQFGLGAGVEVGLPRQVVSRRVAYRGVEQMNLLANYYDVLLPLLLEAHSQGGSDWGWRASLATGLALSQWQDTAALVPDIPGHTVAFEAQNLWSAAWFGRLAAGPVWRPHDAFALHFGASVGCKQNADIHLGVFVEGGFVVGAGPEFIRR
jgi:hypothetical protein